MLVYWRIIIGLIFMASSSSALSESMYTRNDGASTAGTYSVQEIDIAPLFMIETFGSPGKGDDLRVSGEYVFIDKDGQVFSVHDYKSTTVWSKDEGLPSPDVFWKSDSEVELSIGSKDEFDHDKFVAWLLNRYKTWLQTKNSPN